MRFFRSSLFLISSGIIILAVIVYMLLNRTSHKNDITIASQRADTSMVIKHDEWKAPDINALPDNEEGKMIRYGKDLIANTAAYFGPKGKVAQITNGMNCQNCHVDAGLKPYGNCFSAVASIYPIFRPRSGIIESIEFRINDCLQRSLNGKTIDSLSKEMQAMVAYLKWIGKDVPKGIKPPGAGTEELPFLDRAADTIKGSVVYVTKCQSCHGKNGEGKFNADSSGYIYPPLWGKGSYNIGAGLYRLTRFAGYVKNSMPFGATHQNPLLTNEEAWDVAAFVNSQPRPVKFFRNDWPDITKKAIDYPFGPYPDSFSEKQHKFGPFKPIVEARKKLASQKKN